MSIPEILGFRKDAIGVHGKPFQATLNVMPEEWEPGEHKSQIEPPYQIYCQQSLCTSQSSTVPLTKIFGILFLTRFSQVFASPKHLKAFGKLT